MKYTIGQRVVIQAATHPFLGRVAYASHNGQAATVTDAIYTGPVEMPEIGVRESGNRYALRLDGGGVIRYVDEEHLRAE